MNDYSVAEASTEEEKKEIARYCDRLELLKQERSTWETHWQECYDYIVPRKNDVTTTSTPGSKRNTMLFDTTAIVANKLLSGALHGMLTNPSTRFFDLVMGDPTLDSDEDVKGWLQEVGDRMFTVLTNSNFQTEIHEIYIDLGAIGTACLFMGEHSETVVHFNARAMKEVYIDENNLGLIDTVMRVFRWKPRQIVQEFGEENVPAFVKKKADENCDEAWEIVHIVEPWGDEASPRKYKFKSCYFLPEQKCFLMKSGFREMPYAVPRWTKTTGEKYGRGPGMEMLPDIKMINKMKETTLKGAEKTVDPPMMVTDDGVIGRIKLQPAGLTVVRQTSGEAPIRPLITNARIDFGYQAIADIQQSIQSGFYVDQLKLAQGPQMTATEVSQRIEENLRLMGPVLGRQHFELLRPVIDRLFDLMSLKELLPQAPAKIQGKKFDVVYSSMIARAQRMGEAQSIARAISLAAPLIQLDPAVADNISGDSSLRRIWQLQGAPQDCLRQKREMKQLRDARAQAQQAMIQQQQEAHEADVASKTLPGVAQVAQAEGKEQMQ